MLGSGIGRRLQGARLLIEVAEEIIQRPLDAHVDINRDMNRTHLDRLGFHVDATGE